jgi:hypothetical protein
MECYQIPYVTLFARDSPQLKALLIDSHEWAWIERQDTAENKGVAIVTWTTHIILTVWANSGNERQLRYRKLKIDLLHYARLRFECCKGIMAKGLILCTYEAPNKNKTF